MPVPGETVQPALSWNPDQPSDRRSRGPVAALQLCPVLVYPREEERHVSSQFILRPGIGCVGEEV